MTLLSSKKIPRNLRKTPRTNKSVWQDHRIQCQHSKSIVFLHITDEHMEIDKNTIYNL